MFCLGAPYISGPDGPGGDSGVPASGSGGPGGSSGGWEGAYKVLGGEGRSSSLGSFKRGSFKRVVLAPLRSSRPAQTKTTMYNFTANLFFKQYNHRSRKILG